MELMGVWKENRGASPVLRIADAVARYVREVKAGEFPAAEHGF